MLAGLSFGSPCAGPLRIGAVLFCCSVGVVPPLGVGLLALLWGVRLSWPSWPDCVEPFSPGSPLGFGARVSRPLCLAAVLSLRALGPTVRSHWLRPSRPLEVLASFVEGPFAGIVLSQFSQAGQIQELFWGSGPGNLPSSCGRESQWSHCQWLTTHLTSLPSLELCARSAADMWAGE